MRKNLRIGQFMAFYGDREDGIRQLLDAGVDVLVGDYLAELTMLVLRKNQLRGRPGYAKAFVDLVSPHLAEIATSGVKVVTNAGGLEPQECAAALRERVEAAGLDLRIAAVTGDDLSGRVEQLRRDGDFVNLETGGNLPPEAEVLTANAYLGAAGIVAALQAGADIVVCPRVTDAALVVGPAVWHFGWPPDDWDRLASAVVAGHIIECGAQATGGQFSQFDDFADLGHPGLPIATLAQDGTFEVGKAPGTGGVVTVDTVTAQLLYEIGDPMYQNPDVVSDFTSIAISQAGTDRVAVTGVRGHAPGPRLKVSAAYEGGFRNSATVAITGGRVAEKVAWLRRELHAQIGAAKEFDGFSVTQIGPAKAEGTQDEVTALIIISVKDRDRAKVSRAAFSNRITQLAVSSYPGYYLLSPPTTEQMFGVHWPTSVARETITTQVHLDGHAPLVVAPWPYDALSPSVVTTTVPQARVAAEVVVVPQEEMLCLPLRTLVGTRSGDKGGTANLGIWAPDAASYRWLQATLSVERLQQLLPELAQLRIDRFELANLNALNFLVHRFLDDGVASNLRLDAQAKGLGEYLGSRVIAIPASLLTDGSRR